MGRKMSGKAIKRNINLSGIPFAIKQHFYVSIARAHIGTDCNYWTDRCEHPDAKCFFSFIHMNWRYNIELFAFEKFHSFSLDIHPPDYALFTTKYFAECIIIVM